jgi:hypothetical protein
MITVTALSGGGAGVAGEADIPTTPDVAHWRADEGITLNGSNVSAWAGVGGLGQTLSQASASVQPLFVTSGPNGKPYVEFDGVDEQMTSATFGSASGPFHCFYAIRLNSWAVNEAISKLDAEGTIQTRSSTPRISQIDSTIANENADLSVGDWHLLEAGWANANDASFLKVDAGTETTGGTLADGITMTTLTIGYNGSDSWSEIDLAELAIYNTEKTSGDLAAIQGYFNTRYGLGF